MVRLYFENPFNLKRRTKIILALMKSEQLSFLWMDTFWSGMTFTDLRYGELKYNHEQLPFVFNSRNQLFLELLTLQEHTSGFMVFSRFDLLKPFFIGNVFHCFIFVVFFCIVLSDFICLMIFECVIGIFCL